MSASAIRSADHHDSSDTPAPFPLSSGQTGIWNAQHIFRNVPLTVAHYIEVRGELDIAAPRGD